MNKKSEKNRGFLLAELMIAMTIMTVGFLALLGTIPTSMASVGSSRDLFNMTNIAKEKIEFTRGKSFATVLTTAESSGDITVNATVNDVPQQSIYHFAISVYPYKNGVAQGGLSTATCKRVVVTVYDNSRVYRTIKMETSIAKQQ